MNYAAANHSNSQMNTPEGFLNSLSDTETVGRFVVNPAVASFGGTNRLCPAAKTSLYEQMIMTAITFRDFDLELVDESELSLDVDSDEFPLRARVNAGRVILRRLER